MSVSEAVSELAKALRGNPLCLSLVVLMAIGVVFSYFYAATVIEARGRAIEKLIEACVPMSLPP